MWLNRTRTLTDYRYVLLTSFDELFQKCVWAMIGMSMIVNFLKENVKASYQGV